jgi:hypothetical protein
MRGNSRRANREDVKSGALGGERKRVEVEYEG